MVTVLGAKKLSFTVTVTSAGAELVRAGVGAGGGGVDPAGGSVRAGEASAGGAGVVMEVGAPGALAVPEAVGLTAALVALAAAVGTAGSVPGASLEAAAAAVETLLFVGSATVRSRCSSGFPPQATTTPKGTRANSSNGWLINIAPFRSRRRSGGAKAGMCRSLTSPASRAFGR